MTVWLQVETAKAAYDVRGDLDHPLLERVSECSDDPDMAVEFFAYLFWPVPEVRLLHTSLLHPYMEELYADLQAAQDPPTSDEPVKQPGKVC